MPLETPLQRAKLHCEEALDSISEGWPQYNAARRSLLADAVLRLEQAKKMIEDAEKVEEPQ